MGTRRSVAVPPPGSARGNGLEGEDLPPRVVAHGAVGRAVAVGVEVLGDEAALLPALPSVHAPVAVAVHVDLGDAPVAHDLHPLDDAVALQVVLAALGPARRGRG